MEEIQDAVVNPTSLRSKLVDAVSQEICVRPSQFVPEGSEKPNFRDTRRCGFRILLGKIIEPRMDRNLPSLILKKEDLRLWHPYPPAQYKNIIIFIGWCQELSERSFSGF